MSKSLLGGNRKEVEVPLMAMNEDESEEDEEQDTIIANGKKKSGPWKWFSSNAQRKRRIILIGGRRDWKAGPHDGAARPCRPLICIPVTVMLFMSAILLVFIVYPLVQRSVAPPAQKLEGPWTTTDCDYGANLLTTLCPCVQTVDEANSGSPTATFKLRYELANCLYTCITTVSRSDYDDDDPAPDDNDNDNEESD